MFQRSLTRTKSSNYTGLTVPLSALTLKAVIRHLRPFCWKPEELAACDHILMSFLHTTTGLLLSSKAMEEILEFLDSQLLHSNIPHASVADIHVCIGLLNDKLQRTQHAICSLLKALWIQEKISFCCGDNLFTNKIDIAVALTEHRLGLLLAKVGEHETSIFLLESAMYKYGQLKMKPEHSLYVAAETLIRDYHVRKSSAQAFRTYVPFVLRC